MKLRLTCRWLTVACALPMMADAQLQVLADREPQRVFAGVRNISVTFSNSGDKNFTGDIQVRMFQETSGTAAPVGQWPWRKLGVLPGQTVFEPVSLRFPAVKAETKVLLEWIRNTNLVIGRSEAVVYPTNLLAELKSLASEDEFGVLDPGNVLRPVLVQNKLGFLNLEEGALGNFLGRLAIVGPFASRAEMAGGLARAIQKIAKQGVAVVRIQPPPDPKGELKPSFYIVPEGRGTVVVAQLDLVADFSSNPAAQMNLIYFCKLAMKPAPFGLPNLCSEP